MIADSILESEILSVIKKHNIFYIVDIFGFYSRISRATFYNRAIDKLDSIKDALDDNKIIQRQKLKARWAKPDAAPVLQIALFKTISSESDLRKLSQTYQDVKIGSKEDEPIKLSIDQIGKLLENL